jgi:CheY-like chemotaxis protein
MADDGRRALVVCDRPAVGERLAAVLERSDFDLEFAPDPQNAGEIAGREFFDLVLVDYPADGLHMRELVDGIRHPRSPCRYSVIVFFAAKEVLEQAERFRTTCDCQILDASVDGDTLRTAILEILSYNTRHPLRAQVRLESVDPGLPEVLMTETANVSMSGMLVRYDRPVVIGSRFVFSLEHPDLGGPVRGVARVVRYSRSSLESVQGFAARFVNFVGDDGDHFRSFIEDQPPPRPRV